MKAKKYSSLGLMSLFVFPTILFGDQSLGRQQLVLCVCILISCCQSYSGWDKPGPLYYIQHWNPHTYSERQSLH